MEPKVEVKEIPIEKKSKYKKFKTFLKSNNGLILIGIIVALMLI